MTFNKDAEFKSNINVQRLPKVSHNLELRLRMLKKEHRTVVRQNKDLEKVIKDATAELNKLRRPPLVVATIQEVFEEGKKVIVKTTTGQNLLVQCSEEINAKKLVSGLRCALNQRYLNIVELLYNINDPLIKGMEILHETDVSLKDVGGLTDEIKEVIEVVQIALSSPEKFKSMGIDPPKGVLLYGPPGNGKTLIAKAIARKTNAKFISLIGSELVQKYIGEGARMVRELFHYAKKSGPSIIFIDELDAIGSKRLDSTTSGDREVQRTFMQLLAELDGFRPSLGHANVTIIGATNRPEILDPALTRNGRFDRHILIPLPNAHARHEIIEIHTKKMSLKKGVDLKVIADLTENFSGSDLRFMCIEAGLNAIRQRRVRVRHQDFLLAVEKMQLRKNKSKDSIDTTNMFL